MKLPALDIRGNLAAVRDIALDGVRAINGMLRPKAASTGMSGFEWFSYGSIYGDGQGFGSPWAAMQIAPVYAVVKVISESFAQIDCHLHARDEKGSNLGRELDHPLADLLAGDPNPEMSWFELRQYLQQCVALWGNGYAWITDIAAILRSFGRFGPSKSR